jgi:hypothetical protein
LRSSDEIPIWELAVHAREHDRICRLAGLHCRISFNARSHNRSISLAGFHKFDDFARYRLPDVVVAMSHPQAGYGIQETAQGYKGPLLFRSKQLSCVVD